MLLLSAYVAIAYSNTFSTADVLVLEEENFEEELGLHHIMLVKFYAPW